MCAVLHLVFCLIYWLGAFVVVLVVLSLRTLLGLGLFGLDPVRVVCRLFGCGGVVAACGFACVGLFGGDGCSACACLVLLVALVVCLRLRLIVVCLVGLVVFVGGWLVLFSG